MTTRREFVCPECGKTLGEDKTGFAPGRAYCIHGDDMADPGSSGRREITMVPGCPSCGSDHRAFMPGGYSADFGSWTPCPDPWHRPPNANDPPKRAVSGNDGS